MVVELKEITELANSEAVFAVLFIAGLVVVGKWFMNYIQEQREESKRREQELMDNYKEQLHQSNEREVKLIAHLDKNTEKLEQIARTLTGVEKRLFSFEAKVNNDFNNVWNELGSKKDKE